jgi:hypothetical protein
MNAITIGAALGLLLAAGAAEAQKNTQGTTGQAPAPESTATPEAGTVPETGAAPETAAAPETGAAPAGGGLVVASDPQGVLTAMQGLGYTATLGTDSVGDPLISGDIDGTSYNLFFYGCEQNANCQWFLFSAGFDLPNGATLQAVNDWNRNQLVGQAYLDDQNDPYLNYFVTTTGGLTQENFADAVDWWRVALGEFKTALGI